MVYSETLAAVRELYPSLVEDPRDGSIRTRWHPINIQQGTEDAPVQSQGQQVAGGSGQPSAFQTTNAMRKIFFVRFDVRVVGGKPWRVRVEAYASAWKAGEIPTPLKGAEIPPWLDGRKSALEVAIYRRLKAHAVPLQFRSDDEKPKAAPPPDLTKYGAVPADAAKVIAAVDQAAAARDGAALRRLMADDFTYSLGDEPSADTAVAIWQADGTQLAELGKALAAGCAEAPDSGQVVCPAAFLADPHFGGYRAGFARVGGGWKMVFFVAGE